MGYVYGRFMLRCFYYICLSVNYVYLQKFYVFPFVYSKGISMELGFISIP
jgi:hypothetical protein